MLKIIKAFLTDKSGTTLAVTYSFSPNTLALSAQVNQNFQDVVAVVNALTSVNLSDDAVTAAKLNGDVVRATYGLIQHTDGSLYVDVSDTNPSLELSDGGLRVKVDGATIGRTSSGLSIVVPSEAQGDILYRNASGWVRLGAGTSGYFLKTQGAAANPVWALNTGAGVLGSYRNLLVTYTSATAVTITADELVLEDTSNNKVIIRTVSEVATITTAGASGLVVALSEAANTIYYVWIARKSSDGTVNAYLSTTTSLATFATQVDSGYDQFALVSCVGNDNSSNFISFKQTGSKYCFTTWATMGSGNVGTTPWVAVDLTPANMSTNAGFVPPNLSTFCFGVVNSGTGLGAITNNNSVADGATAAANKVMLDGASGTGMSVTWALEVLTADTLYWISATAGGTLYLQGFELNKLH